MGPWSPRFETRDSLGWAEVGGVAYLLGFSGSSWAELVSDHGCFGRFGDHQETTDLIETGPRSKDFSG